MFSFPSIAEQKQIVGKLDAQEALKKSLLYQAFTGELLFMELDQSHIEAFNEAETLMAHRDFCPYLELKALLPDATPQSRARFRSLFTKYYGLNVGGLTDAFKNRFFAILFAGRVIVNGQADFPSILNELSLIPRKKGDYAMPFSFVSKLVAIHRETSPIYDRHVLNFFNQKAPAAATPNAKRITWYVDFLNQVATDYAAWAQDVRVTPILNRLRARDPQLAGCDAIRLMDFLVWKVGNQKLL